MSRSRSFNRFHSYLAQQKRRGLRADLPQFQDSRDHQERSACSSDDVLRRLNRLEMELDLLRLRPEPQLR